MFSTPHTKILRYIQNPSKPQNHCTISQSQPIPPQTTQTPQLHEQNLPKHRPDVKKLQPYPFPQTIQFSHFLDKSKWKHIGHPKRILNQTNCQIFTNKSETLSLGLKFATDIYKNIITITILSNYWNYDTDFFKGFIQGIILTTFNQMNHHCQKDINKHCPTKLKT